ncbi:hypothetical protein J40TS1_38100 [Paenibacillus montaniterrae]|uniref:Uncharacterized protein n=1 Tax=Paenibacillus montaniterrae TaxID=429341 RepID=A0A919YWP9_9BACL|nr:hypothetical protein [Paenibacillus montaniterrae]GIP18168.1 hypothetical protein J40TS1_38100 [Paenibacillus montaniterrae]
MEVEKKRSEFTLANIYSWRSFYLSLSMSMTFLIYLSVAILVESDVKYVTMIFLGSILLVIFILMLSEWKKDTKIIVNAEKIIYRSEELNPAEIEEIIFVNWIIDIKRKKGIRSCIRIALKNNEEFETFKSRIIEYGNYNNIRIKSDSFEESEVFLYHD